MLASADLSVLLRAGLCVSSRQAMEAEGTVPRVLCVPGRVAQRCEPTFLLLLTSKSYTATAKCLKSHLSPVLVTRTIGILTRTVSFGLENVIDGGLRGDATWFWLLPGLQGLQHCAPAPTESHLLQPDGRGGLSGESNGVAADPRCDVKVTGRLVEFANAHVSGPICASR